MLLILVAEVENVYQTTQGVNDKGETYGGGYKAQLKGRRYLSNGESRVDLLDLNVKDPAPYRQAEGSHIAVPVGAFAPQRNVIRYFPQDHDLSDQEKRCVADILKNGGQ
jgi:hypothetical protein